MEVISTTTPIPPTGTTSTATPLGISGAMSQTTQPLTNQFSNRITKMTRPHGLYYGKFTINSTNATGANLFSWRSKYPLGSGLNNYTNVANGDTIRYNIPWDLIPVFYSKQSKVEWKIEMTPVKVADSRVSLDIVHNYVDRVSSYGVNLLNNDSIHKLIDDQDDPFDFIPPQYFPTKLIQTDGYINAQVSNPPIRMQPAFLPTTRSTVYVRNQFQPNQMQPASFEVIVTLTPIVRNAVGFAGKKLIRVLNPVLNDFVPIPFFMNYE